MNLMSKKKHSDEQPRNDPRTALDLLDITAEDADYDIRYKSEGDSIGDVIGEWHYSHSGGKRRSRAG